MKLFKALIVIMSITLYFCIYISEPATAQANALTVSLAQETDDSQTAVELERSSLSSPAAAQRAENVAEASASKTRVELLKARQSVASAEAALSEAKTSGKRTLIDEAQGRYDAALRTLCGAIADSTGITIDEIFAMRSAGMGWAQIAYELGVNPIALGIDNTKVKKATEMEMATARNPETEDSMWHGTRFSGKGMGLDSAFKSTM